MFNKITEREKLLAVKIKKLEEEVNVLKNQNSYLAESSMRWAKKFRDPKYSVPARIIEKMEQESEQYRQRSRAEREALKARISVLIERVIQLTYDKADDLFGRPEGNKEISYEFAANHIDAQPTEEDHNVVHLELSKEWAKRMESFSS